jgi:carbon monoxide dehydrogenase subunit G
MELSGDYLFDAPQNVVWAALLDPNVLGAVMPGGKGFEQIGENQYSGVLEVKVGPVQGNFQGKISLAEVKPPESYRMEVDGKGAPGFVKATGGLRLETRGSQTYMEYSGEAQIGGRIASVGQRLIDSAARSIVRQSLEALNEYLKLETALVHQSAPPAAETANAQLAAEVPVLTSPVTTGEYKPPTQTMLMARVARDVFGDLVPAKYQPWVLGGVAVVILLIIWLIVSR